MKKTKETKFDKSLILLARSSLVVLMGIFLSKVLTYLYRIIMAREFGPEAYGLFSIATMVLGWFLTFADLGLSHGVMRYTAIYRGKNQQAKIRHIARFTLLIVTITGVGLGLILFAFSGFIANNIFKNSSLTSFLIIFSPLILFTLYSYVYLAIIRGYAKINWYSFIFNIVQNVVKVVSLAVLIILGAKIIAIPISYALGGLSIFIISYYVCKYKIPNLSGGKVVSPKEKLALRREMFAYSLPLLFFSAFSILFYWIDSFSIGYLKGAFEVGLYNAAVPIALLFSIIPELFMQFFFPFISREYAKGNTDLIEQTSKQVSKWIFMINLPLFILLFLFPGTAINLLFGPQYLEASTALRILAIGGLISSLGVILNQLITALGKTKLILINIIIASAINLTLNFIFIPMKNIGFIENASGISGAALATVISVFVLNLLLLFQFYSHVKIVPFRRKMLWIAILSIIPLVLLIYLRSIISINLISVILLSIMFLLIYTLLIILCGGLDKNDMFIIRKGFAGISFRHPLHTIRSIFSQKGSSPQQDI